LPAVTPQKLGKFFDRAKTNINTLRIKPPKTLDILFNKKSKFVAVGLRSALDNSHFFY